jgi:hypothetical protein
MDIKELVKYQVVSQLGAGANSKQDNGLYHVFIQILLFMMMSCIDEITKGCSKGTVYLQQYISTLFKKKIADTIETHNKPKTLNETSLALDTRHYLNTLKMKRVYNDDAKSVDANDASNKMVDAVLKVIAKLDNVPSLVLNGNGNTMLVYKEKPVQVTKDIFIQVENVVIDDNGNVTSLVIALMSNIFSAAEISAYVYDVYNAYMQEIKNSLGEKLYFFDQKTRDSVPPPPPASAGKEVDEASLANHKRMVIAAAPKQLQFTMTPFYSNKKFTNIYGEETRAVERRVKFFVDNKDWYDQKGIPYQLGILLSGVPGAGKTSIIRAIANYTKRHIINVNFSNISTATQLKNLFYSDKITVYTDQTCTNMQTYFIPVEQRLYVLEEIDAVGDIVKQRTATNQSGVVVNDELTLGEILTVLDGTMEIPGRIVIMTSNHPEVLDKALIRPGRIDVAVHFGFAKRNLIAEMYEGYFDKKFPVNKIQEIPDKVLTPAEVGQILFRHFDDNENDRDDNVIADMQKHRIKERHTESKTTVESHDAVNIELQTTTVEKKDYKYAELQTTVESHDAINIELQTTILEKQSPKDAELQTTVKNKNPTRYEDVYNLKDLFEKKEPLTDEFYNSSKTSLYDQPDELLGFEKPGINYAEV